jgi:glycosyltransferase involved in cell wall biosynthesis
MTVERVTAVIPTAGRRSELAIAVRSALSQRDADVTVNVVGDGTTYAELAAILGDLANDVRVRITTVPGPRRGSNAARNHGACVAQTEWVAFLDDDDEWHEQKVAQCLEVASAHGPKVLVSHKFIARTREGDDIWPRDLPQDSADLSEYLFCRRGMFDGDGHLQTSTLLTRRALALEVPFREDLRRHQDHDWVLRCVREAGAALVMVPEVLSVYAIPQGGDDSIASSGCWRERFEWAASNRHLFSARGYAGFLMSYGVFAAALDGDRRGIRFLVREAFRDGRPRVRDVAVATALATIPQPTRRRIRALVSRAPRAPVAAR